MSSFSLTLEVFVRRIPSRQASTRAGEEICWGGVVPLPLYAVRRASIWADRGATPVRSGKKLAYAFIRIFGDLTELT